MLLTRTFKSTAVLLFLLALVFPAQADDSVELSNTKPVAIISSSQGDIEVKGPQDDAWRKGYRLTLLYPEDSIRTGQDGEARLTYFYDNHSTRIEQNAKAKVELRSIEPAPTFGTQVERIPSSRDRALEIEIPYILMRPLDKSDFYLLDKGLTSLDKEKAFLAAYVDTAVYPPQFHWAPSSNQGPYKLAVFNQNDEFLHEFQVQGEDFRYPPRWKAPFRLTKGSVYYWQVTNQDDDIVVRKYPFMPLTQILIKDIAMKEQALERNWSEAAETQLFLTLVQRKAVDKYLHLLQDMEQREPNNPLIQRALVRAYLTKGTQAHAARALQRERDLGMTDVVHTI